MKLPYVTPRGKFSQSAVTMMGLNLTGSPQDVSNGYSALEWAWTENCDTVQSPIVRRREVRKLLGTMTGNPNGIYGLGKLAFVDGTKFYWGGYYWGDLTDSQKQMIGMGSDIVIFPDKKIFSTVDGEESFRDIEQTNTVSGNVRVTLARADGTSYGTYSVGVEPPPNPDNGALWLDTSEDPIVMKVFSKASGLWVDEYTTCVMVQATGIGAGLKVDDAVEVTGLSESSLNGTWTLLGVAPDHIIYTGVISQEIVQSAAVTVKRSCPDMDFVVEHNNRLWGCSSENHEIYACALGDPTNWRRYQGISTDSYAVTVGSPGPFTGAAVVNSSVCFFKEDCIHKIYGTMPSNFQMSVDHYRGVEQGSGQSIVRINELVYYKSRFDICCYDGSEVAGRGRAIGPMIWKNAVAGRNDRRLYVSMQDAEDEWHLLVYDTETGYWMREDGTHAVGFASLQTESFMLTADGEIWALRSSEYDERMIGADYVVDPRDETDDEIPWLLRTGPLAAKYANNKKLGKIQMLVELDSGAHMLVRVRKDNEDWEDALRVEGDGGRRYTLPIYPRRCDRLEIELSGTGGMKLHNMSWQIEQGSEYGRD